MKIIGVDPGTNKVGFAFIEKEEKKVKILDYGILFTSPTKTENNHLRLLEIASDLESLIQKFQPDLAVVEDLFFFKNQKTIISVAQSRGVILYILAKNNIQIISKTPLQLKQTICGYGRAEKKQVQFMVQKLYNLKSPPNPDDAADALALAWIGKDVDLNLS